MTQGATIICVLWRLFDVRDKPIRWLLILDSTHRHGLR